MTAERVAARLRRAVLYTAAWYVGATIGWLIVAGCRRTDLDTHPGPAACKWCTAPVGDPGMLECDDCLAGRPFSYDSAYYDDGLDDDIDLDDDRGW